ncbi:protein disulfide isomerase-like 1-6 [Nymphaea colorata]|nr:protein disulfide isomerase-like 1-6 [Nymphaea colorata]
MSSKSRLRFMSIGFFLFILLSTPLLIKANESEVGDEDLDGLEELLAAEKEEEEALKDQGDKFSEAEIVKRAQAIVVELNNDNTERIVGSNEYVLVMGYATWCARSAELMPHFAQAANSLKEMGSSLVLAKVDAERYSKAATFLGVKGFPTLLLFVNGTAQPYTGGFTGEELVIWATKKTGAPVVRLSSKVEAQKFLNKHQTFVIGLFENFEVPSHEEFVKAAISNNDIQFVETSDVKVAEILYPGIPSKSSFVGFVKSEPEKFVAFEGALKEELILKFTEENKFPLVTVLTELNAPRVYGSLTNLQVFIFAEVDDYQSLLPFLQNVARKFKSKIMFIYVDPAEENLAKPILSLFGLETEEPIALSHDYKHGLKYLLDSKLTMSSLEEFCSGLLSGTLLPFYKSEPVSENNDIVQKVVGKTFDIVVLENTQNVLLEVYTPWCINCDVTSKQVEKLAKYFKGQPDLIFARIDASTNEHPKLQVDDFPTLLFYPAGDKSNPIKVPTKSSLKELAASISKRIRGEGRESSKDQIKDEL